MCDLLIASELAVFADTHGRLGLLPGWGQMARLPNAVGIRRATELLLTSRACDAGEALELGLVNAVVPHADTVPRALALAAAIGESDQPAVRAILAQLREGANDQMAAALARERERADLWQGQGFDTDLVSRKRKTL
jgi:enoyl-CoA hydratase